MISEPERPFEGLAAVGVKGEQSIGAVYQGEQGNEHFFRLVKALSIVRVGHPLALWSELRMALSLGKPHNIHLQWFAAQLNHHTV